MGRYKEYESEAALFRGVKSYFDSITRREKVLEPRDTGELDKYGHKIYEMVPAMNGKNEEVFHTVYLLPPSVGDLCEHLKISSSTWHRYCQDPEFEEVAEWATDRFKNWRMSELVTRPDKLIGGIKYDLELNYKTAPRKAVEVTILGGELKGMEERELQEIAASMARRQENGDHT